MNSLLIKTDSLYIFTLLILTAPAAALGNKEYTCSIKNVSKINDNGYFVRHGWAANYQNREFTVDITSGKVLSTTALKERLNNFDLEHEPLLLNDDHKDRPLTAFTFYPETGTYALLQINNQLSNSDLFEKPYFYHTSIGMILSGTCRARS
jgi:hypothetical protein